MSIRKFFRGIIAAALFATIAPVAQAASSGPHNFNVTVSLTSVCTLGSAISDLAFGTYTAFGAAVNATPVTATFSCTRGLTGVTANFDTAAPGSTAAAAATNAVGAGVIQGLQYNITATPQAVVAGTPATASSIGTADSRPYEITGVIAANQAGDPTQNASPQQRQLTINF